ncbi:hypothetical protein ASPCAL07569 [Aspergillus calidoustus]|uniref:Zn(2)-C6 fungal-type domain-containing protein n=1 Tax=Aspergillus calidoustus TaxID=454130 RepID=A0A0U5GSX6_ASPCI|nr:hypothetical protein ASPCAL07569 [Aspergillus calidoustus]
MTNTPPPATKGRRFHHKSRYGCAPCKRRRIKCDEKKPVCGNCTQRSVECSFRSLEPTLNNQQLSRITTVGNASSPLGVLARVSGPGVDMPFCRSNSRDLELYCHFQIYTSTSLAQPVSIEPLYREFIPGLAVSFPFVGHGLMSIAYIHLATISPQGASKKLLAESAYHLNQALPGYSETIKNITAENSTPLFSFAMFVVLFTFANSSEESGALLQSAQGQPRIDEKTVRALGTTAARVAQSIQNIFGIFWRCQHWISAGPMAAAIRRYLPPTLSDTSVEWIRVEDVHLAKLPRLWENDPTITLAQSSALSSSLACLRDTFAMVTQLTVLPPEDTEADPLSTRSNDLANIHQQLCAGHLYDAPSVFTWYIRLSPDFLNLLEEGNQYAMVVLAHFAIVLDRACAGKWWTHRLSEHFVAMADVILGEERREWIEWPLTVIAA